MIFWKIFFIINLCNSSINGAKILGFFTVPFHSHQSIFRELIQELARRGHQLTIFSPLRSPPIENVRQIDVENFAYTAWDKNYDEFAKFRTTFATDRIAFWEMMYSTMHAIIEAQINSKEMQAIIENKNESYDLIIVEAIMKAALIPTAAFKAPVILVSSFFGTVHNFVTIGATTHPILYPDFNRRKLFNLSVIDKLVEIYLDMKLRYLDWQMEDKENKMICKYFGSKSPSLQELRRNVRVLLLNLHHIWDNNRPVPPSVVYMGALQLKTPNPLPIVSNEYILNL